MGRRATLDFGRVEDISSQCDGATSVFSTTYFINLILYVRLNGALLIEGVDFTKTGDKEITLTLLTPESGEELHIKYT